MVKEENATREKWRWQSQFSLQWKTTKRSSLCKYYNDFNLKEQILIFHSFPPEQNKDIRLSNILVAVFLALNTPGSPFDLPRPPRKKWIFQDSMPHDTAHGTIFILFISFNKILNNMLHRDLQGKQTWGTILVDL